MGRPRRARRPQPDGERCRCDRVTDAQARHRQCLGQAAHDDDVVEALAYERARLARHQVHERLVDDDDAPGPAQRQHRPRRVERAGGGGRVADDHEIVPTNGAAPEALWLLLPTALRPTLAPRASHPGFTESEAALRRTRQSPVAARAALTPEHGFALDPGAVPDAADLVIVGNPASPTGTLDPAAAVLALRRPGRVVVVDEAFMDLVPGEPGTPRTRAPRRRRSSCAA